MTDHIIEEEQKTIRVLILAVLVFALTTVGILGGCTCNSIEHSKLETRLKIIKETKQK